MYQGVCNYLKKKISKCINKSEINTGNGLNRIKNIS